MSINSQLAQGPDGSFTAEQQRYLEGFFAGINARGLTFGDLASTPVEEVKPAPEDFTKEERDQAGTAPAGCHGNPGDERQGQ